MNVTVLIPTYNYAHFILDAIRSIEAQSYPLNLIEVIVIDDGSTDNTKQVIMDYKTVLNIHYYFQENKGKAHSTQLGIEKSNGQIIFNLDADDYFYPEKIATVISIYETYPNVVSVGHAADIIYSSTQIKEKEVLPEEIGNKEINGILQLEYFLNKRNLYGGGSTFSARKSVLELHPIFTGVDMYIDEYLIYSTYAQGNIFILNSCLSVWRVHGKNYSVESNSASLKIKIHRLLRSSTSMLEYIENQSVFSNRIKELYRLKHLDRYFTSLEAIKGKGLKEYIKLSELVLNKRYSYKDLKNYRVFNRFIPASILNYLKKI